MLTAYHPQWRERRYAGLALTVLVHAALLLAWQMDRHVPAPDAGPEPVRTRIQWIWLPARAAVPAAARPKPQPEPAAQAPARHTSQAGHQTAAPQPTAAARDVQAITVAPPVADTPQPAQAAPPAPTTAPTAAEILQRAKRDIGKIDRALRKENNPYIVLPPDSPQIRMRNQMEAAHDMAAPSLWEAPKVEELVNNTGDGARRSRVITGNGTYCITDRAPNTSIDMIEKHGKQRFTSCPAHETPAGKQEWRTARD